MSGDPSGSSEKYATRQWTRRATVATSGSSALRIVQPSGFVTRHTVDLTSASLGQRVDPLEVEVVRGHVREHRRLVGLVAHATQDEAAARRLEDRDVDVRPAQDRRCPARASPVTLVDDPLVDRIPSEVVVPTWCPARSRMWVISRVTVDLPLVPVIEMIGIVRASSRIQVGGVAPAPATRSIQRATMPDWVPVRRTRRPGWTDRDARSKAASAMSRDRSAPVHGQVITQRPVSDARWTWAGPPCSSWSARRRRVQATRSVTSSGHSRAATGRPRRTSAPSSGVRDPCHARVRPTATSTLTTGISR